MLRLSHDDDVAAAVSLESGHDVAAEEPAPACDEHPLLGQVHDNYLAALATGRCTTWRPMTRTSMCVRRKQSSASRGRSTMGSFSLNDVLSRIGTPLMRSNALMRFQYRAFERRLTVWRRPDPSTWVTAGITDRLSGRMG